MNSKMYIKQLKIENFKSIEKLKILFNEDLNIFTGVNNSGKTTILEGLALWAECFKKLINQAKRSQGTLFVAGDYILGPTSNKYFDFDDINSVRSPFLEDLFRNRDDKNKILLSVILRDGFSQEIEIDFEISKSVGKYIIKFQNHNSFDYTLFNRFFRNFPEAIGVYYASPVAHIQQAEDFVTDPTVSDNINKRNSSTVIRNRLYRLYQTISFSQFQNDLSYILFNNSSARILFVNKSDINKDQRVLINYTVGHTDIIEKDIALLGSGTLQSIEILLNIYQFNSAKRDLNLVLLDEPDSHIHRDIQGRLLEILLKFSNNNQVFLTTHNESMIRSAKVSSLFHIDSRQTEIKNLSSNSLQKTGIPHFRGLIPHSLNPIIKSLGNDSGLDFINAIEADLIVFVEGEEDARVIYRLLNEFPKNKDRKIMFWVLGGNSQVFDKIKSYHLFFNDIKNTKTLWAKSVLVIDRDDIQDSHIDIIQKKLTDKFKIESFFTQTYTLESSLFTNVNNLTKLLVKYFSNRGIELDTSILLSEIESSLSSFSSSLITRYTNLGDTFIKQYKGKYIDKINSWSSSGNIKIEDIPLKEELEKFYKSQLDMGNTQRLLTKGDCNEILKNCHSFNELDFDYCAEFVDIVNCIDKSLWFDCWDFVKSL